MKKEENHKIKNKIVPIVGIILLIAMAGCTSPLNDNSQNSTQNISAMKNNTQNISNTSVPASQSCGDADCFITAADNCEDVNLTLSDDVGAFAFSSSKNCVFTKILVSLNLNETQEMKNALVGKNMTCIYEKGKFDQRWVTTLIGGMEYCNGELKDTLGKLIIFT